MKTLSEITYQGNKNRLMKILKPFIENNLDDDMVYIEPFGGGMNSFTPISSHEKIANDFNEYNIALWVDLKTKGVEKVIFSLIKPQLIANQKRYENGCRGGRPNNNQIETKAKPNENDNVNVNYLKEEEKREEEKTSQQVMNNELRTFCKAYDIAIDGYNANIHNLDFNVLAKAFSESIWLRKNITSLQKICTLYPKIESGYYKDYIGIEEEIIIPQEEWGKVESVLMEMKKNSENFNSSYDDYRVFREKQDKIYNTLPEDVRAYYVDYNGFIELYEYKTLENEKARFVRDFEKFCKKRRMKNVKTQAF